MAKRYIQCWSMNEKRKLRDLLSRIRDGELKIISLESVGDYGINVEYEEVECA